jgi:hypothetical protein
VGERLSLEVAVDEDEGRAPGARPRPASPPTREENRCDQADDHPVHHLDSQIAVSRAPSHRRLSTGIASNPFAVAACFDASAIWRVVPISIANCDPILRAVIIALRA